jgi:hypothetical protein
LTYTLQQLSDLEDIRTLKHRYFRCIDTANVAELEELFTDDVTVDYRGGNYRVQLSGKDNMVEFLANAFHSDMIAMHHGHMPEIRLTGHDSAEGTWYLEDMVFSMTERTHLIGTALYKDRYRREDEAWKIAHTEYDRVIELILPLSPDAQLLSHYLGRTGRRPEERTDQSAFIQWS